MKPNLLAGIVGFLVLWANPSRGQTPLSASQASNTVEIRSLVVDGKSMPWRPGREMRLSPFPERLTFNFGAVTNSGRVPTRLRYRLEGYDPVWREGGGEMFLTVRFFDAAGDLVAQQAFGAKGESSGWAGTLKSSTLTHRRETVVVPAQAVQVWVVISSAGPPATVGIYVVADLVVSRLGASRGVPEVLLRSPFGHGPALEGTNALPEGWIRDGTLPSMARVVELGQESTAKALAILDEDAYGHAEWHTLKEYAPAVHPGDRLEVEWNELFSMGVGDVKQAQYEKLAPGDYRFRVAEVTALGVPTGAEAALVIRVPLPMWQMPWFWGTVVASLIAVSAGSGRYIAWHKMRRQMRHLEHQRMLEQERLRIAQDIHDDLGARVTQISLLSAMAQSNGTFPEKAREEFDRISRMSRDLVAALYETVWAVNPENDNLDALGTYLCQMVNQLCEPVQMRCRFHLGNLPSQIQVSSQLRHNICLAVKEAVHNAIKHAQASEINVHMEFDSEWLTLAIADNGSGFEPAAAPGGNGLKNMTRRLEGIGGSCSLESQRGRGTTVRMRLCLQSPASA